MSEETKRESESRAAQLPAQEARERRIVHTSVLGIVANVLLAAFKAAVGLVSNSIAITLDAVNNLSDALSSVITIVGTKLAAKPADRKHPLGYGRVEYLSAMVIAVIVLYAGVTSAVESVRKIVTPEPADYSLAALVVVAAGIAAKLLLGRHVRQVGEETSSDALVASGTDALSDAILSASTLAAALVYLGTGVSLEAWVGAVISAFIVKAGLEMLRDTLSQILGERADADLSSQVKAMVAKDPDVLGVYDLVLHSYGPEQLVGSLHVEVPDTMTAHQIDDMTRRIEEGVYRGTSGRVIVAAVGIYARDSTSAFTDMRNQVARIAFAHDNVIQLHGFHVDEARKLVVFDVVVSFDAPDRRAVVDQIKSEVEQVYPGYRARVTLDADVSD